MLPTRISDEPVLFALFGFLKAFADRRILQSTRMIKHIEYSDNPIIVIEPGKRGGKPCIRDLRITVYDVLVHLASGITPDVPLEYVEARVATVKFSH